MNNVEKITVFQKVVESKKITVEEILQNIVIKD